jgi:hypothetical protein
MTRAVSRLLVASALLGLAGAILSLLIDANALLVTYLATVTTISAIAVGATGVLMMTYLVRGNWTEGLHVPLSAAALTTPVAALLFLPVLIGIPWIYPWAHQPESGPLRAIWLTPWSFVGRTVLYFVIWTVLALWVHRAWGDPRRMIVSASAGLIVFALTVSLAGIDWLESLTPEFHSSIYGLLSLTFAILTGFAFALIIALSPPGAPTFRYGAILLSVLLLWAYNHAMQYIIIWSGNIPEEVDWYIRRESGGWGVVLWTLVTLQFILPFFAMLSDRVRNVRGPLLFLAAMTLALRFMEAYLLALPGSEVGGAVLWLTIPATILLCGAVWWIAFGLIFDHVRSSAHDLRPVTGAFDQSGSPMPTANPRSGRTT